jgi:putative aldouronate transport system permease protein
VLPLSKAIIAVLALWSMVGHWNSYFTALIYLRDRSLFPLQLILRNILVSNQMQSALGTGEAAQIALRTANLIRYGAIIVSTLPIMCAYPFVQKYFNQGVMIGAVKG